MVINIALKMTKRLMRSSKILF